MGGAASSTQGKSTDEVKSSSSSSGGKVVSARSFEVNVRLANKIIHEPGVIPDNVRIFFVLGPPGSGKTTQCKQLSGMLGYTHINLGDLLRDEIQRRTPLGQKIAALMAAGETVPNDATLTLLKQRIAAAPYPIVLLDGYPRSMDQVEQFHRSIAHCTGVLLFNLPLDVALKRVLGKDGASDTQVVRRLHKAYLEQVDPVVRYFTDRMKCQEVEAGNTVEAVGRDFLRAVEKHLDYIDDDIKSVSDFEDDSVPRSDGDDNKWTADQSLGHSQNSAVAEFKPVARMVSEAPWIAGDLPDDLRVIFVLGPPGSGKSTQCEKMHDRYGCAHLYVGDLLRAEVKSGSALGRMAEEHMANGQLVPIHISLTLLKRAMLRAKTDLVLVDGFPRSLDQVRTFEKQVAPCSGVLFFDIDQAIAVRRVLKRGETSGRVDDNTEAIAKQFQTFMSQAMPVREHYAKLEKCQVISGEPPPDAVFEAVASALKNFGESLHSFRGKGSSTKGH